MTGQANEQKNEEGGKLWAGKYTTPEEMETAIKAKDTEASKLLDTNRKLQQKIENSSVAPDHYDVPSEASSLADLESLKRMAKSANLTQDTFNKLALERLNESKVEASKLDDAKKAIGDSDLILLNDYVKKNYPEAAQDKMLNEFLLNPAARAQAMAHRNKTLSSRTPGMDNANAGGQDTKYDGQEEVKKAAENFMKNKNSKAAREKLIETAREVGQERYKK